MSPHVCYGNIRSKICTKREERREEGGRREEFTEKKLIKAVLKSSNISVIGYRKSTTEVVKNLSRE